MNRLMLLVILVTMDTTYSRKFVDLTHTLDEDAPKWPLGNFGVTNLTYYKRTSAVKQYFGSIWLSFGTIEFYEHMGTHMDAPSHFGRGRQSLNEIPLDKFLGPGVVINVREQAKKNNNYSVTIDDIHEYERKYGRIKPGSIVLMNSGWSEKYPSFEMMFSTQDIYNSSTFRFPGFSGDACMMLNQERQVGVVGVDVPSVDIGSSTDYPCHVYLLSTNVPLLEFVANVDSIPPNGTTIMLGAMKVRGATGAPVRILAFIDDDEDNVTGDSGSINSSGPVLFVLLCLLANVYTYMFLDSL